MLDVRIADRIEPLLDLLVDQLIVPGADPFAREWVAVPSIGMRRWLSQRLSERLGGSALGSDGISANIDLPFPAELRRSVLAADAVTREAELVDDLWVLERLTWAVLDVLTGAEAAVHPDLAPLTHPPDGGSLVGRAVAVADLLDRYSLHRPSMVRAWAAGVDVDAAGTPIAPAQRWQPALFRAVARHIGVPAPAVRMDDVLGKNSSLDCLLVAGIIIRIDHAVVIF